MVLATAGIAFQAFFLRSSRESIGGRAGIMSAAPPYRGPEFRTQMARSEAKTVDSEIAHNENNDDHYANYSEDIHFALLPLIDWWRGALGHFIYPTLLFSSSTDRLDPVLNKYK